MDVGCGSRNRISGSAHPIISGSNSTTPNPIESTSSNHPNNNSLEHQSNNCYFSSTFFNHSFPTTPNCPCCTNHNHSTRRVSCININQQQQPTQSGITVHHHRSCEEEEGSSLVASSIVHHEQPSHQHPCIYSSSRINNSSRNSSSSIHLAHNTFFLRPNFEELCRPNEINSTSIYSSSSTDQHSHSSPSSLLPSPTNNFTNGEAQLSPSEQEPHNTNIATSPSRLIVVFPGTAIPPSPPGSPSFNQGTVQNSNRDLTVGYQHHFSKQIRNLPRLRVDRSSNRTSTIAYQRKLLSSKSNNSSRKRSQAQSCNLQSESLPSSSSSLSPVISCSSSTAATSSRIQLPPQLSSRSSTPYEQSNSNRSCLAEPSTSTNFFQSPFFSDPTSHCINRLGGQQHVVTPSSSSPAAQPSATTTASSHHIYHSSQLHRHLIPRS